MTLQSPRAMATQYTTGLSLMTKKRGLLTAFGSELCWAEVRCTELSATIASVAVTLPRKLRVFTG